MKLKQLLISGALICSCSLVGCTTISTIGDKALGFGPTNGVSSGVMIGAALITDGIIYLYDNSDNLVQAYEIKNDTPEPVDRSDYVCYPEDEQRCAFDFPLKVGRRPTVWAQLTMQYWLSMTGSALGKLRAKGRFSGQILEHYTR